ncbi:MAG: hypothetical protein AB7P44_02360 [Steroidobacteraceae bacterium]
MSKFMPIGQDSIAVSCHFSGRLFSADPDGMNIQRHEKTIVKRQPAKGYCFLSLRQFFPETWAGIEPEIHVMGTTPEPL